MVRRCLMVTLLAALSVAAVYADGPETGALEGTVTDPSGSPLPGVLVTADGGRGQKTAVTDAEGKYRFTLLVPGSYAVKAQLEGMDPVEAVADVTAGGKTTIDLALRLATEETITVTSEAPMVDKYNVTAGATVTAEVGEQTAGSTRTYYGVINTLPGVASDAENDDIQQTRPSVNGSHFADQAVYIDGVDTTFAKFGGSRVFLPTTAVTEISMEAGGSSAEYGRAMGSSTNVIVKSGTNTFKAAALVEHQKAKWGADYKDQPSLARRETNPFPIDYFRRTDLEKDNQSTGWESSLGGPVKRDKAWFFLGWSKFDDSYSERLLGGDPVDTSLNTESRILKFNLQPTQNNSLAASYIDTPSSRVYFNPNSFDYWTPTPHVTDGDLWTLNWNYSVSSNLFFETKIAKQTSTEDKQLACGSIDVATCLAQKQQDRGPTGEGPLRFPADPSMGPFWPGNNYFVYVDQNFLDSWHNGWILSDGFGFNEFPRDQANATMTQFVGANHEIKYGLDYQDTKWEGQNYRTGLLNGHDYTSFNPFGFQDAGTLGFGSDTRTCGVIRSNAARAAAFGLPYGYACNFVDYNPDFLQPLRGSGDAEMENVALYIRDRFSVGDHWTFNIGLRGEQQQGWNDIRRRVIDATYVDPRISATYDVKGDGRLLFTANTGRYHAMLNQAWIAGGGDTAGGMHDGWNGYEGRQVYLFCDPVDVQFLPQCSEGVGYNYEYSRIVPGRMWVPVDAGIFEHDIDPYYKEEFILGMEWQFSRNWALDVKYIDWSVKDIMFSNTQIDHLGENIFLTGNYKNLPKILAALEAARQANGIFREDGSPLITQETLDNFQQAVNEYQGLQVQLNRRFSGGWALYNNISFAETETTGGGSWWNNTNSTYGENLEVLLTQEHIDECNAVQATRTVPVDCTAALTPFLGQPASTINRRGPNRVSDREIIFNSFGFKTWDFSNQSLTLGGHVSFQTGTPWNRSESVSAITLDGRPGNNTGVNLFLEERGAHGRRTSDEFGLNLSGAYGFPVGGRVRGEFRVEMINATNEQKQRDFDGEGEVYPVRRFFQRPRQLRANMSFRF